MTKPQFSVESLRDLINSVEALRDQALRNVSEAQARALQTLRLAGFSKFMPVSVTVTPGENGRLTTQLQISLPGFDKSEVDVSVADKEIRIHANHGENHPLGLTGEVSFSYPLPANVEIPEISCEMKAGVLTVSLPSLTETLNAVRVPVR